MKSFYDHHGMTEADAYDMQAEDPQPLECRYCGTHEVRWGDHNGKWRLFSTVNGRLHTCLIDRKSGKETAK